MVAKGQPLPHLRGCDLGGRLAVLGGWLGCLRPGPAFPFLLLLCYPMTSLLYQPGTTTCPETSGPTPACRASHTRGDTWLGKQSLASHQPSGGSSCLRVSIRVRPVSERPRAGEGWAGLSGRPGSVGLGCPRGNVSQMRDKATQGTHLESVPILSRSVLQKIPASCLPSTEGSPLPGLQQGPGSLL